MQVVPCQPCTSEKHSRGGGTVFRANPRIDVLNMLLGTTADTSIVELQVMGTLLLALAHRLQ